MNIAPAAELAIRGIRLLAEKNSDEPTPLDIICKEGDLPKQYLIKIFSLLAKADLVRPVRGKRGGYLLGRPAADISLLQIIESIQGPLALNFCQHNPTRCDDDECPGRSVWAELQQTVTERLAGVSLADLRRKSRVSDK